MIKSRLYLLMFCFSLLSMSATAQQSSRKKDTNERSFASNLWYGGNLGIGFSSSNLGSGLQGNVFFLSVAPMVGYKLNDWLSAGPRVEVQWYTGRFRDFGQGPVYKFNVINLGGGLFARAKFLQQFFAHAEYGLIQHTYAVGINTTDNRIETESQTIDQFLVGAGISFGGVFSSEFSVLYNLLAPEDTIDLPIVLRYGFTYNF